LFLQGILDKHTVCKSYNHKVKLVPNQKKISFNRAVLDFFLSKRTEIDYEMTSKQDQVYEVNRIAILAFRSIGKGRSAVEKVFNISEHSIST